MLDIVFSTNEFFAEHCCVAITSLLVNNPDEKIRIHLLCIELSQNSIDVISAQCKSYNAELNILVLHVDMFKGFPPAGTYSLACYSRLFITSLLPSDVNKVLYLDCDMIVRSAIKELWETSIDGYSIAAVPDTHMAAKIASDSMGIDLRDSYINSGMLLINLDYWRQHEIEKRFISFLKSRKEIRLPDQDTINYVLSGSIKIPHPRYNAQASYFVFPTPVPATQKKYIKELFHNAVIAHFSGGVKPWHRGCVNPYKRDYQIYRNKTPYRNNTLMPMSAIERVKTLFIFGVRCMKGLIARALSYTYN